jgi:hypothetical protein
MENTLSLIAAYITIIILALIVRDCSITDAKIRTSREIIKTKTLDCLLEKELGITK